MPRSGSPFTHLTRIALLVAAGDYITKYVASVWVGAGFMSPSSLLSFAVVHNDRAAFSLSAGDYTWQLNLAFTVGAIALILPVSRDLARVDRHAPTALGLIVGGAVGNFASLVLSARGVVDFIAVRTGADSALVLNVADMAAYAGLVMLLRTAYLIVRAMRSPSDEMREAIGTFTPAYAVDSEVPRLVYVDGRPVSPAYAEDQGDDDGVIPLAAHRSRRGMPRPSSHSPVRPMSHPIPDASDRL